MTMSNKLNKNEVLSVSPIKEYTEEQKAILGDRLLPVFKGYTIDIRCGQIRKVDWGELPVFIDMNSEEGRKIIDEYAPTLDMDNPKDERIMDSLFAYYLSKNF